MLQLTYLGFTCGEAVSPVITRLFLVSLNSNQFNNGNYSSSPSMKGSFSTANPMRDSFSTANPTKDSSSTGGPSFEQKIMLSNYSGVQFENHWPENSENRSTANLSNGVMYNNSTMVEVDMLENIKLVRYAYAAVIPVCVIVALWFLLIARCEKQDETAAAESKSYLTISSSAESTQSRPSKILLLVLMALFYWVTIMHEATILTLITPIAIKSWGWEVKTAALTSTVIMSGYLVGRLLSMFVSAFVEPVIMLATVISLLLVGTIQLLISQYSMTSNKIVIMSSLVILGLGQSALTAVNLFLVSKYVTITPAVSSLYLISVSSGLMVASYSGSRIYEVYGHFIIFWILLVLAVFVMLFFVMEVIVGKQILNDQQTIIAQITNNYYDNENVGEISERIDLK